MFVLSGCVTVGPDYVAPGASVSKYWHTQIKGGIISEEMGPQTLAAWWTILNDQELSILIERAMIGQP